MELDRRETVDAVDVELEEVIEEDPQRGFISHNVVDGNVERVCASTELEHDGGNKREFVEAEVGVHVVCQRHVVGLLVSVGLLTEVGDRGVVNVDRGINGP